MATSARLGAFQCRVCAHVNRQLRSGSSGDIPASDCRQGLAALHKGNEGKGQALQALFVSIPLPLVQASPDHGADRQPGPLEQGELVQPMLKRLSSASGLPPSSQVAQPGDLARVGRQGCMLCTMSVSCQQLGQPGRLQTTVATRSGHRCDSRFAWGAEIPAAKNTYPGEPQVRGAVTSRFGC